MNFKKYIELGMNSAKLGSIFYIKNNVVEPVVFAALMFGVSGITLLEHISYKKVDESKSETELNERLEIRGIDEKMYKASLFATCGLGFISIGLGVSANELAIPIGVSLGVLTNEYLRINDLSASQNNYLEGTFQEDFKKMLCYEKVSGEASYEKEDLENNKDKKEEYFELGGD